MNQQTAPSNAMLWLVTPAVVVLGYVGVTVDSHFKAKELRQKTEAEARAVSAKVQASAAKADGKLNEIHTLVNSRLTEALDKIAALEKRLGDPPSEVPPRPTTR